MRPSPYGLSCELSTRMVVVDDPRVVSALGDGCLVETRKDGGLPDFYAGTVRRLGKECITHCLARQLVQDRQT